MESKIVLVEAEISPMNGDGNLLPNQIYRNPRMRIGQRPLGDLAPENIRVKMLYAGICGTDVHLMESDMETGYIRSTAPLEINSEGRVIGHEGVGQVLAVGERAGHVPVGSYVTFESIHVCFHCFECRRGRFNQCENARLMGLEKDGLFGTVVDMPCSLVHDVTRIVKNNEDLMAAACVEPAAVAYVACENGQVTGGDSVVVFGAGPIGLYTAILCQKIFGTSEVHLVEPNAFRRTNAGKWCDHVYDVAEFFKSYNGKVDVVVEASGDVSNVNRIFRQINANGRIVMLARSGQPLMLEAIDHMITNAITLIGSRGHLGGAFQRILDLYRAGRIPLFGIVTHVLDGLEEIPALLESKMTVMDNCKVLVKINDSDLV